MFRDLLNLGRTDRSEQREVRRRVLSSPGPKGNQRYGWGRDHGDIETDAGVSGKKVRELKKTGCLGVSGSSKSSLSLKN